MTTWILTMHKQTAEVLDREAESNLGAALQKMKNSTRQTCKSVYKSSGVFAAAPPPSLYSYCLAEFFTGAREAATDLQTNFFLNSNWLTGRVLSALKTKRLPTRTTMTKRSSRGGKRVRAEVRGGGRWRQKQMKMRNEWRERVNSHVTAPSGSVDGEREIQQPQKQGWWT